MEKQKEQWDSVIRPRHHWYNVDLKGVLQYRDLILLLIKRHFTLMYRQTVLGPAWVVLQPLLTTVIFTVVFGNIANLPTDGMPKFMFYMAGSVTWQFFANCLTRTSTTFIDNRNLFGKVYFPRLCMPISVMFSEMINFLVQFMLFIIFVLFYALQADPVVRPNLQLILFTPLLLLQLGLMGLGFGVIISALTTRYRDLAMLVSFGIRLWMYLTPVTYSSSMIADRYPNLLWLYMLNPITPVIELFRAAYLGVAEYTLKYNLLSVGVTFVVLALGVILFSRTEKTFMDTI